MYKTANHTPDQLLSLSIHSINILVIFTLILVIFFNHINTRPYGKIYIFQHVLFKKNTVQINNSLKQFTSVLEWFRMSCSEWKQWLTVYNYSWWNLRKYSIEGWKDLFLDNRFGFHFCGSCEFTFYIGTPGINEKFWVVWERMLIIYRTSGFSIFFFSFFQESRMTPPPTQHFKISEMAE